MLNVSIEEFKKNWVFDSVYNENDVYKYKDLKGYVIFESDEYYLIKLLK